MLGDLAKHREDGEQTIESEYYGSQKQQQQSVSTLTGFPL